MTNQQIREYADEKNISLTEARRRLAKSVEIVAEPPVADADAGTVRVWRPATEGAKARKNTAYLDVGPEFFVAICTGLKEGGTQRTFVIEKNGLPPDVEFVSAALVHNRNSQVGNTVIRLTLQSESFTEGEQLEPVTIKVERMETVFTEARRQLFKNPPIVVPDEALAQPKHQTIQQIVDCLNSYTNPQGVTAPSLYHQLQAGFLADAVRRAERERRLADWLVDNGFA